MTHKFPLTITEVPHQGSSFTWTIESEEHLNDCIDFDEEKGYTDWQIQEGRLVYIELPDGDFIQHDEGAYTLEAYLDWLRYDLSSLIIHDQTETE